MDKLITDFSLGLFFWQTLLFVILIFVLKKYAWKPILSAVEESLVSVNISVMSALYRQKSQASLFKENLIAFPQDLSNFYHTCKVYSTSKLQVAYLFLTVNNVNVNIHI